MNLADFFAAQGLEPTERSVTDYGQTVICDICNRDMTNSQESGGFLFGSYAYCPECAVSHLASIRSYGEEKHIKAHCPKGKSYADWVRDDLRKGDNRVIVQTFKPKSKP